MAASPRYRRPGRTRGAARADADDFHAHTRRFHVESRPARRPAGGHARVRLSRRQDARRRHRRRAARPADLPAGATGHPRRPALPRRTRQHRLRRDSPAGGCSGARRLALRRPARAVLPHPRAGARHRRARLPGGRMGPHAPLLRALRNADAGQARRARQGMPGVRLHRLPARHAGHDGAGDARARAPAGARAALSARHVQRARRLRRARRDDRGLHPPRSARGSGDRGRRASGTSRASRGRFRIR